MDSFAKLFSEELLVPSLILAFASFLAGLIVELVVAKLAGGKPSNGGQGQKQPSNQKQAKGERFEKRHPAPADGSIEIYVGNLSYDLTEDQLRSEFEAYGKVNSARIITNRFNNKSKGFGFVHMPNRAEADAAVKALNDKDILGRKLKCNEARNLI